MDAAPLFELENVSLTRGGRKVLDRLSARFPAGASAIVGPSGAGKSTLLRLLDRLSDPDEGTVRLRGTDTRGIDPLRLRREVALVPQVPVLAPGTVADNLRFAAELGGDDPPDTERLLSLAGLAPGFAERDVERMSVGEQQRAMIARALATEPEVLLLDEPTSALDEEARNSIERTLAELRDRLSTSIVLVTHDRGQAARVAGWVVSLAEGRLVAAGPAEEPTE